MKATADAHRSGLKRWQIPDDDSGPSGPLPARGKPTGLPSTRRGAPPQGRSVDTIRIRELFG